jgi:hypothetical protein
MCDGDSGSWVVHSSRLEVYGHVVASDTFGAGYVIPMTRSLEDIRRTFNMASVELPTLVDVACKAFTEDFQDGVNADLAAHDSTPLSPPTRSPPTLSPPTLDSGDEVSHHKPIATPP